MAVCGPELFLLCGVLFSDGLLYLQYGHWFGVFAGLRGHDEV